MYSAQPGANIHYISLRATNITSHRHLPSARVGEIVRYIIYARLFVFVFFTLVFTQVLNKRYYSVGFV